MNPAHPTDCIIQRFSVPYEYPVYFTRDVFGDRAVLHEAIVRGDPDVPHRVQVFLDAGLVQAQPGLPHRVEAWFAARHATLQLAGPCEIVPGGEAVKNSREAAEAAMALLAARHLCRQSCVVAVGGGSMLDVVGLAAALVHRGVRLVRVPTTVLAQADSGVGVKNGIDAYGMKNFAGTFAPPYAVVNDFDFLRTLPDRYWYGGLAEAFKVALIKDPAFFDYLERHADALRRRDEAAIEHVVRRTAALHLEHIATGGDPFEFGAARPLDFGHWAAHRIEVLSGYDIPHGTAVGIGMALDTVYACRQGLLRHAEQDRVLAALAACGLPVWSPVLERVAADGRSELLRGLDDFREHLGGQLHVTLPGPIGQRTEVHAMDPAIVLDAIAILGERHRRAGGRP